MSNIIYGISNKNRVFVGNQLVKQINYNKTNIIEETIDLTKNYFTITGQGNYSVDDYLYVDIGSTSSGDVDNQVKINNKCYISHVDIYLRQINFNSYTSYFTFRVDFKNYRFLFTIYNDNPYKIAVSSNAPNFPGISIYDGANIFKDAISFDIGYDKTKNKNYLNVKYKSENGVVDVDYKIDLDENTFSYEDFKFSADTIEGAAKVRFRLNVNGIRNYLK